MSEQKIAQILEAERLRRVALVEENHQQVERLFADDLVYVHTTGLIHNKADYLAYARDVVRYVDVQRDQLEVRLYGDTAVMTGFQTNTMQKRSDTTVIKGEGFVTQVWVHGAQGWQMSSFHGSRLPS